MALVNMGAPIFEDIIRSSTGAAIDTSGLTTAQRTALTTTSSINQNLPHPAAGVSPSVTKPAASAVSAVKSTGPAAAPSSSNTTTYLIAGGAAVALVGIIVVIKKRKKKR